MRHIFSLSMAFVVCGSVLFMVGCQKQAKAPGYRIDELGNPVGTTNKTTEPGDQDPEPAQNGPRITFESELHNFGEIDPKSKNRCEFKFTNTGDAELIIKRLESPCRCTVPELAKKTYAPGESGIIKAVYTAEAEASSRNKVIYVFSNDPTRPSASLTLKAKIVLPVRHRPSSIKLLLNAENAGCPNITLTGVDDQPFAIKSFTATAGTISASFDPSVEQTKFVIEPKVNLAKLENALHGTITIGLTHPSCKKVTIAYKAVPRFRLDPRSFVAGKLEPGKTRNRTVWVLSNYNEDFEIELVTSKKGFIELLSKEKVDTRFKLELQITPPAPEKMQRVFTDTLQIKIKDGKELTVSCTGWYLAKPKK